MHSYVLCVSLQGLWPCAESRLEGHQTVASPGTWLSSSHGSTLAQQHCQRTGRDTLCVLHSDREKKTRCGFSCVLTLSYICERKQIQTVLRCTCVHTSGVDASVDLHLRVRGDHAGPPGVGAHLGPHQISDHKLLTEARLLDHWWMMDLRNLNMNMNESLVCFQNPNNDKYVY